MDFIPNDIFLLILGRVDPSTFCQFGLSCKRIHNLTKGSLTVDKQVQLANQINLNPLFLAVKYNQLALLDRSIEMFLFTHTQNFIDILEQVQSETIIKIILTALKNSGIIFNIDTKEPHLPLNKLAELFFNKRYGECFEILFNLRVYGNNIKKGVISSAIKNYNFEMLEFILALYPGESFSFYFNYCSWDLSKYSIHMLNVWKRVRNNDYLGFDNTGVLNMILSDNLKEDFIRQIREYNEIDNRTLINVYSLISLTQRVDLLEILHKRKWINLNSFVFPICILKEIIYKQYVPAEEVLNYLLRKNCLEGFKYFLEVNPDFTQFKALLTTRSSSILEYLLEQKLISFTKEEIVLLIELYSGNASITKLLFSHGLIKI